MAGLLLLAGCDGWFGTGPGTGVQAITELPRALTASEQQAISSSNDFGFELLNQVASAAPGTSVFLSPFSASMALGMAMNGANGGTFDAMRHTLHFGDLSEAEINDSYRGLLELLRTLDPSVELAVANSVWHRQGIGLRQDFRTRVESHFGARVQGLDFSSPTAPATINGWVKDATRGKIDAIVPSPIPAGIVAYLLNAVYFNGNWSAPFNPNHTRPAEFHLWDGGTAQVRMMTRDDTVRTHFTDAYAAVDLPYGGGAFSMSVVVPRGDHTLGDLLRDIDSAWWNHLTASFTTGRALVSLPSFELEWEAVLNDQLVAMGMGPAFEPGTADFSRMFETTGVWIDEVRQKTFVRVDEVGTEAAAVTSIAMPSSMPPEVRADRPFLMAIRERLSGTILFLGAIVEAPQAP